MVDVMSFGCMKQFDEWKWFVLVLQMMCSCYLKSFKLVDSKAASVINVNIAYSFG